MKGKLWAPEDEPLVGGHFVSDEDT